MYCLSASLEDAGDSLYSKQSKQVEGSLLKLPRADDDNGFRIILGGEQMQLKMYAQVM